MSHHLSAHAPACIKRNILSPGRKWMIAAQDDPNISLSVFSPWDVTHGWWGPNGSRAAHPASMVDCPRSQPPSSICNHCCDTLKTNVQMYKDPRYSSITVHMSRIDRPPLKALPSGHLLASVFSKPPLFRWCLAQHSVRRQALYINLQDRGPPQAGHRTYSIFLNGLPSKWVTLRSHLHKNVLMGLSSMGYVYKLGTCPFLLRVRQFE